MMAEPIRNARGEIVGWDITDEEAQEVIDRAETLDRIGQPVPPTDVRVICADGSIVAVECFYNGVTDGCHEWAAIVPPGLNIVGVTVGILPAHTSVVGRMGDGT